MNLALRALGGELESWTSERNDDSWAAANLIDGRRYQTIGGDPNFCDPCGWRSADDTLPQEFVFSFHQDREALVGAVVIDSTTIDQLKDPKSIPNEVEVWASSVGPSEGFTRVAADSLEPVARKQTLSFPPVKAKFVKLILKSTHGGRSARLGEVEVLEAAKAEESILHDLPRDIASPELGGAVVWFTSARYGNWIDRLFKADGKGWRSSSKALPQSLVLVFNEDRRAFIDSVVVDPEAGFKPKSGAKTVAISVSDESPLLGFREIGRMELALDAGPQTLTVGKQARYLKLDILENHGGGYTSLGRVQVFEGAAPGVPSVLAAAETVVSERDGPDTAPDRDAMSVREKEPNDEPAQAPELPLGKEVSGMITPSGNLDHYRLKLPSDAKQILNLEVSGRPVLDLLDQDEKVLKHLDLGTAPTGKSAFSLALPPGDLVLRVSDSLAAVVLLWDVSMSLGGNAGQVKAAVTDYIEQLPEGVLVNLIAFSGDPKVLLEDFTDDKAQIVSALEGGFETEMGSALFDAVAKGLELLGQVRGNRALIVLGDGGSQGSGVSHSGIWQLLRESSARLYTIGFGAALEDYSRETGTTNERMLRHMAQATGGRYLRAPSAEALSGIYQEIAEELHRSPAYTIRADLSTGSGRLSLVQDGETVAPQLAPTVELVVDASGSMKKRSPGGDKRRKIDLAKEVLSEIVDTLPDESLVALRVYGHRVREGKPGDCEDTELLVPFRKIEKARFKQMVQDIRPLGTTPLAYSLKKAGEDLSGEESDRWLVLITDGKEECGGDPTQTIADLRAAGIQARIDVVGLALGDVESIEAVRQYADLSGGSFFDAQDREELRDGIRKTLAVPFDVLDAAGDQVARESVGSDALELPEGVYTVVLHATEGHVTYPDVRIAPGKDTRLNLTGVGKRIVGD